MKNIILAAAASLSFSHAEAFGQELSRNLLDINPRAGISGTLQITDVTLTNGRIEVAAVVEAPQLLAEIDSKLSGRGNMGSSRKRLFWAGPSKFSDIKRSCDMTISSRARYEIWAYVFGGNTRLARDTKSLSFSLRPHWNSNHKDLTLNARLDNIRNFPNWAENLFKIRDTTKTIGLSLNEIPGLETLNPTVNGVSCTALGNQGLRARITASANAAAMLSAIWDGTERREAWEAISSFLPLLKAVQ